MYITYCRNQKSADLVYTGNYRLHSAAGEFRPTYLVRVSDWKKVPGIEARNGYCALSYCWAQSGVIVQKENGEYDCIDRGRHCIVEGYDTSKGDSVTIGRIGETDEHVVYFSPSTESNATIRHVTYGDLLQQICKDFFIEYLWYDKICIDQSDDKIKQEEIKQMHRIYSNACYTLAMVPEVHVEDPKDIDTFDPESNCTKAKKSAMGNIQSRSLWWKRSWTLEETMSSKRILFCGTDTNFWQHSFHTSSVPTSPDVFSRYMLAFAHQQHKGIGANLALSQAHFRTSSKEHDKIFSLANIFHDLFQNLNIDYQINFKTTLRRFYQTIATSDLSILGFGSNLYLNGDELNVNTFKGYHLPSWAGVDGQHISVPVTYNSSWLHSPHFICDDMLLHISTQYYKKLSVIPYEYGCFSPLSHDKQQWQQKIDLFIKQKYPYSNLYNVNEDRNLMGWFMNYSAAAQQFSTHYYQQCNVDSIFETRPLSLTEDCKECIVLPILLKSHMFFKREDKSAPLWLRGNYSYCYFLPVLKKCSSATAEERYKAIGIFFLGSMTDIDLYSYDDPEDEQEVLRLFFLKSGDGIHDKVKEFKIQ